jgi:hypothetical protein
MSVDREQFEVISPLEVVHIPTRTMFWAYPYSDPQHLLDSIKIYRNSSAAASDDNSEQIRRVASQLLLDLSNSDRRIGQAA